MATKGTKKNDVTTELKESAHKIWLAGLGAVAVAEEEGSKFFRNLVDRGEKFEDRRKKDVGRAVDRVKEGIDEVKDEVETRWQQIGDSFDRQVANVIERLGVPTREEIHKLTLRVEDLTAKLEARQPQAGKAPKAKTAARKTAARKTAARKTAARKTTAPKATKPRARKSA